VEIPAGTQVVHFNYQPLRWKVGLGLCIAGVGMICFGFELRRRFAVS
jgi:hypothetical protein